MNQDGMRQTSFMLDARTWGLLRALAAIQALEKGGRPSQGAVLRDLIERAAEERLPRPMPTAAEAV